MSTTTARSSDYLQKMGYVCCLVEKMVTIPARPGQPERKFLKDAFDFCDLLCTDGNHMLMVQSTTTANQSSRVNKILGIKAAALCLRAGADIEVHGWSMKGARGERKLWTVTVTELGLDSAGNVKVVSQRDYLPGRKHMEVPEMANLPF